MQMHQTKRSLKFARHYQRCIDQNRYTCPVDPFTI